MLYLKIKHMKPSIKTICKKNPLQDGLFPIYLRVTINRKSKFYSTPYKCKLIEWNSKTGEFNSKFRNHLSFNSSLRTLKDEATDIIEKIQKEQGMVTLIQFDNHYRLRGNSGILLKEFFENEIKLMEENRQISYKISLETTIRALGKFKRNIDRYRFEDIDESFLNGFERHLRKNADDGGIAVYMRNIRMVYNKAIKAKVVSKIHYPFSKEGYKISKLKSQKKKKALSEQEFEKIIDFDVEKAPSVRHARYLYIFSYYARGMNFTDLAELEWSHLEDLKFSYSRIKTKAHINVKLPKNEIIGEILDFYKKYRIYDTPYIFPILKMNKEEYSAQELYNRKYSVRKYYNKQLKYLLQLCEIDKHITFYTARHTFATTALRKDVNINIIKQSLGHKKLSTTESYLEDFSTNEVDLVIDSIF
ncbi:site-specific integrase [Chryseobacterium sp.]|uniref:site-specific integrase n=1 Tax=Chryseobacterium sp. TaxID=1871047 RepID=UPI00289D3F62|nr:site-specific integrase [Chryseobacterium sp.]